jgi:hypothetical protein
MITRLSPHARSLKAKLEASPVPEFIKKGFINIVTIPETRHHITPRGGPTDGRVSRNRPGTGRISFGSFNARSIYGREQELQKLMVREDISYVAVTEPMLRPGDPPRGLPSTTLASGGEDGRRGQMWIPNPRHNRDIQAWAPAEEDENTLWAKIDDGSGQWLAAAVYLSHDVDEKVDRTVSRLLDNVSAITKETPHIFILITGDFNADPFANKGKNLKQFRRLMTSPHLVLVQRPNTLSYSRPAGKSHIDNVLLSKNAWDRIASEIEYAQVCDSRRVPSDHLLLIVRFPAGGRRPRTRPHELKFDTAPLAEGKGQPYRNRLQTLAEHWLETVALSRRQLEKTSTSTTSQMVDAAWDTLKYLIYSASYQSLSTVRTRLHRGSSKKLNTKLIHEMNTSEMWKMVKRRLLPGNSKDTPLAVLDDKLRLRAQEESNSGKKSTRQWVKAMNKDIDRANSWLVPCDQRFQDLMTRTKVLLGRLIRKLRNNVSTGLDNITALQIKAAPPEFVEALAWLIAWCMEACVFPSGLRIGRMKFIVKPAGDYRGIMLEALLAKLIENVVVDPVYPCFGGTSPIIAQEQLANRRGTSAEIASAILGILIDWEPGKPLALLISDIQGAYDNVWRKGAWAKMADSHAGASGDPQAALVDVKRIKALYRLGFK